MARSIFISLLLLSTACGSPTLTVETVQQAVASAANATIEAVDKLEASRFNKDSRSCSWMWDGHMINSQVRAEPAGNKFDSWASRIVAGRIADKGYVAVDGIGDSASFLEEGNERLWSQGEELMVSLSYGGPSRSARLDVDSFLALAGAVGS